MLAESTTKSGYYDERHGGPYDRGSADAWYGREFNPHYFVGATYSSPEIRMAQMTAAQITAYAAGYRDTEFNGKGN